MAPNLGFGTGSPGSYKTSFSDSGIYNPNNPLGASKTQAIFKLIELPNSALYTLLDSLLVSIRRGDVDDTIVIHDYNKQYEVKFNEEITLFFSSVRRYRIPFLFWGFGEEVVVEARCCLIRTRSYLDLSGIFQKNRKGDWITKSGLIQIKEIYFALKERGVIVGLRKKEQRNREEKLRKEKAGNAVMELAEDIEKTPRITGGGGTTKAEIRESGGIKIPHVDGISSDGIRRGGKIVRRG